MMPSTSLIQTSDAYLYIKHMLLSNIEQEGVDIDGTMVTLTVIIKSCKTCCQSGGQHQSNTVMTPYSIS